MAEPRNLKKFVIGVVVAILIVCLTLAAILIGVYFSIDGENNLVKVINIEIFQKHLNFVKDVNYINA